MDPIEVNRRRSDALAAGYRHLFGSATTTRGSVPPASATEGGQDEEGMGGRSRAPGSGGLLDDQGANTDLEHIGASGHNAELDDDRIVADVDVDDDGDSNDDGTTDH